MDRIGSILQSYGWVMKLARDFLKVFLAVITCVTLGCQGKKELPTKTKKMPRQEIRINILSEPQVLDPRKARALADINLARTFMEGLMRIDQKGNIVPGIAEKYTLSEDMQTYTFSLRESSWSNKEPLTAHDFVYAWKKVLSPDFLSDNAFLLYPIKNAKAIKKGDLPLSMLGVSAKDDYTLIVELEKPIPYFTDLLVLPVFFPVNTHIDRKTPDWHRNAESYVGNGPFMIKSWEHNDNIVAVKNPDYWDAPSVKLEKIAMMMVDSDTGLMMFQNEELDWEGSPFSTISIDALPSMQERNTVKADPLLGTYWIRLNTSLFPLHSQELRKALSHAINREEIVTHVVGSGIAATSIVPASLGLRESPNFVDGDASDAEMLLTNVLEKEKFSLENFPEITLTYTNNSRNHRVAQSLQDQWKKRLNLHVRLESIEGKVFFDRLSKGDYQMAIGSWVADYRDPLNFLEVFKSKTIGTNNTGWESLDYQKALEESYLATTVEKRKEILGCAEKIITEESPVIPIFQFTMLHVQNEKLVDVLLTDSGYLDFRWAYITE